MQLKVFCCSCFFDVMLKVKHFSPDLIRKVVEGDITSCFKLCSFRPQCNVEMERQITKLQNLDMLMLFLFTISVLQFTFHSWKNIS